MKTALYEIGQVVLTSVFSLVMMFWLTKLGGKRQIAQMSPFDYINSITIGSIAAELATDLEAWYRPLAAMIIYGLATWLVHVVSCKSISARCFLGGRAAILMENGVIYKEELNQASIDLNEFLAQARIAGYFDLNEIESAILETSGQISFLPKSLNRPASPEDLELQPEPVSIWTDLIIDGVLQQENLKKSGYDAIWLKGQLHQKGIGQTSDVFYAACDKFGGFFACREQ